MLLRQDVKIKNLLFLRHFVCMESHINSIRKLNSRPQGEKSASNASAVSSTTQM